MDPQRVFPLSTVSSDTAFDRKSLTSLQSPEASKALKRLLSTANMENEPSKLKKRTAEPLTEAGVFKKALVSPTAHSGETDQVFKGNGGDLALLRDSRAPQENHGPHLVENEHQDIQHPSSKDEPKKDSLSDMALKESTNAAAMTTMADLLASAGDSQNSSHHIHHHPTPTLDHHQDQGHAMGTVSDEVLKMQQQLQQQIPLDPETNTRLIRDHLMESMTGIILQDHMNGNLPANGSHTHTDAHHALSTTHSPTTDNSTVLMNLRDPSILATLKPATVIATSSTSNQGSSPTKKKPKASRPAGGSAGQSESAAGSSRAMNDRRDPDSVGSDNPLHTKWLMATALKEKGIAYRTGTFSSHEDELIRNTIKDYVSRNNMAEDAIQRWFENGNGRGRFEKNDLKALWVEIAVKLQTRPLLNIYLHVRRMFHPQNNVGTWSKEDDQKLVMLYAKHKGQWTTIGTELGRMADSCRDRYRNHLKDQSTMVTGPWQPQEDEKLLGIMQDLAIMQGKTSILDSSPMWTLISERMDGTRTRHQCRHRYSQTLQPRLERGEWTGPSSAAAAAAAAVAANATSAAAAVKQQHQHQLQLHTDLGLGLVGTHESKVAADHDVIMLAAALQGVIPSPSNNGTNSGNGTHDNNSNTHHNGNNENHDGNNNSMLWAQAISNTHLNHSPDGSHAHDGHSDVGGAGGLGDLHHHHHHDSSMGLSPGETTSSTDFTAAAIAVAASFPSPAMVPRAPKGPIRRRGGLQQQLDVLKMIQESGCTDHTEIQWAEIAQRLRANVQESNAIQLAKIIQTHDQLDSQKQQHQQDGDSAAAAAAAAAAAMAAAVAAAQAEAVASLQRIPASNQIARTFMSSRCKTEGYRQMTLQQVVAIMMQDVERRIQHRRGGSSSSQMFNGSGSSKGSGAGSSSSSLANGSDRMNTTTDQVQQQQINEAAQQAAIAALSAQFPFLQQHQQQQQQQQHLLPSGQSTHQGASSQHAVVSMDTGSSGSGSITVSFHSSAGALESSDSLPAHLSHSSQGQDQHASQHHLPLPAPTLEEQAQHQQELLQQQHNRDLAEKMLNVAFTNSDMTPSSNSSSSITAPQHSRTTRRVLHALKSSEFVTDTSDEGDEGDGDGEEDIEVEVEGDREADAENKDENL